MAKIFKHRSEVAYFDYKDFKTLQRYVNVYGEIEPRKKTGLSESLAAALKRCYKKSKTHCATTIHSI